MMTYFFIQMYDKKGEKLKGEKLEKINMVTFHEFSGFLEFSSYVFVLLSMFLILQFSTVLEYYLFYLVQWYI